MSDHIFARNMKRIAELEAENAALKARLKDIRKGCAVLDANIEYIIVRIGLDAWRLLLEEK